MEESRNAPGEDRISMLPDGLIHHILSFNDTKYAVQTSVLSKRWIHVWKSLPVLEFNRSSFSHENTKKFIEFVYMVFMFRDDTDLQKFSLDWEDSGYDNTVIMNVNRWSLFAVKYNVQEISIAIEELHNGATYEIPHLLLNSKTLRKLEIQVFNTDGSVDIILPRSVNSPQLKELRIYGLSISNLEFSKGFFSSCPVLENFCISGCRQRNLNLIVDSLSLKKFTLCWNRDFLPLNATMPNIIKLCAPSLEHFVCKFYLNQDYSLQLSSPPPSRLFAGFHVKLNTEIEDENSETYEKLPSKEIDAYAKRMIKFLGAVYMVKDMRLSPGVLEVLSRAPYLLDCQPPRFCNLQSLVLEMWPTRGCLRAMTYLLSISPNITRLFLEMNESNLSDVGDYWEAGLSFPTMLSHLEHFEFIHAEGSDAEFKILSFLLKNEMVLKKIGVTFRSGVSQRDRKRHVKRFWDKIRAERKASSTFQFAYNLKFSW